MNLYYLSSGLIILGALTALAGVISVSLKINRLRGVILITAGVVIALTSGPAYAAAQKQMRAALSSVPPITFRVATAEATYTARLQGADAACLAAHIQMRRAVMLSPNGTRILQSLITSLTATPARLLPRVTPTQCRFDPTPIYFTANPSEPLSTP